MSYLPLLLDSQSTKPFLITVAVILLVLLFISSIIISFTYTCYKTIFTRPKKIDDVIVEGDIRLPGGPTYEPHYPTMIKWTKEVRELPHENVSIKSFDGLTLRGKYYEYAPGAIIELMMHGYKGCAERDMCGGVQRAFALKRNVLLVDQRACGESDGKVITFGINERRDCLSWVNFIVERYGADSRIILTGISMGGATVMMASAMDLPKNVIGILSDCGFNSAKDIIYKRTAEMHMSPKIVYPFIKLAAKMYGQFDLDETSAEEAIKECKVPAIFIHGEDDDFVPPEMSRKVYESCPTKKVLVTVPGAAHGTSYIVDPQRYIDTLANFEKNYN